MKLGLYGGGFKPFHTGHFAKLLLALDEADKVISFFGIKKQKFSKRTGKPLKTNFRKFGDGPDARSFDQEMQEKVVSIYEDALEAAFPGRLDIVPSSDETPITKIFNVLNNFAYQNMTEEERSEVLEDLPQVSGGQNFEDFSLDNVDEIVVVAGQEELDKTYMSGINRQAEKSTLGKKVKDLIGSGKIKFETSAADQQRLVDLLSNYREDASDDHVMVRGTDVRNFAGKGNVDSLRKYIPSVIPEDQKNQIVKILIGDKSQNEGFFMPIITDSTVLRAAARFTSSKPSNRKITEQKKKGEGHILGLTEDMALTFDALKSLISDVLSGRIDHIEEKMDGQNFTFTVLDNGEIRIFGKGVTSSALDKGGKGKADLGDAFGKNKNLLDAFSSAYNVVEKYLDTKDADLVRSLFQNGRVVIEGQIMTPINPNTIPYTENHVRFVKPFTPDDLEIDMNAYRDVFEDADVEIQDQDGRPWSFGPVPKLAQVETDASEIQSKIAELENDIETLIGGISPTPRTVGDYASHAMEKYIEQVAPKIKLGNLSPDQKQRALERLATGNKSVIGKKELAEFWPEVQKFEKLRTAHVAAAIADLEKIVQKLGTYFFDTLEFALATNDAVVADLAAEVEKIKQARSSDSITIKNVESGDISDLVDTSWATKLDSSLSRVEQMDLFKKAVEGVVLRMPDAEGNQIVRKLTGMFTPIHRLVSLFRYPDRYSKQVLNIEEPSEKLTDPEKSAMNELLKIFSRKISESKGGFKNTDGQSLTVDIDLKDVEPTLDHFFKVHLSPAGVELYRPIGSTGKKSKSGDLDIVIQSPCDARDKKAFKNNLVKSLNASLTDGQAKLLGQNIAVMYPIQGGDSKEYVQIDVMMDDSPCDAAWLMSGTGDGGVKGVYRNLMLSYIANRRNRAGEPSEKMTISFPGGLQIKIMPGGLDPEDPKNKRKWQDVGKKIRDPGEIMNHLGISGMPEDIETFQELVDVMREDETLSSYLSGFEEYIQRYLDDKKSSDQAKKAVDYINSVITESSDIESLYDIIELLLESEVESDAGTDSSSEDASISDAMRDFSSQRSFSGKMRVILNILKRPDMLGGDIEKINNSSSGMSLVRFGMKPGVADNHDFNDIANRVYREIFPDATDSVVELAPYESPNPSGTYTGYMMPGLNNLVVIFGTSGTSGGQRKAGYIYEDEIGEQLQAAGMSVRAETDNAYSDVYVTAGSGELGIEVKLPNAQAGEPTIRYDFDGADGGGFFPSNPKPQNQDIANLVNMDPDMPRVRERMILIRDAINSLRAKSGKVAPIESILGTISREEYTVAVRNAIADSPEGLRIAKYTVSTNSLREYYLYKGAGVVQVKGKGLYHLHPEFKIDLGDDRETKFFDFPEASGAVYFRNNRGINYAMRTQFSAKPLSKLEKSGINLDNPDDRRDFAKFVSESSFPDSKSIVAKMSNDS